MTVSPRATRAEINLANLRHNLAAFRAHIGKKTGIMAVVKADAYGHGAVRVAGEALKHGATMLGTAFVEEGIILRENGLEAPLLVLNPPFTDQVDLFFKYNLTPTVFTRKMAEVFSNHALKLGIVKSIHVKVDTGMGRVGVFPHTEATGFVKSVSTLPHLHVEGIYTHFATADEEDKTFAEKQLSRFFQVIKELESKGLRPPLVHAANSAASIDLPHSHLDMVRLGISMYGHFPSENCRKEVITLKPLLSLKSRISHLKEVPGGTCISYGCTYITTGKTTVATIPLGYADGYSRLLSGKADVLIGGKRHPVIGRVCMDQFMVDVSSTPNIKAGDEVVLYGKQGSAKITVEEIASLLDTINYEVLCAVNKRVPRIYTRV